MSAAPAPCVSDLTLFARARLLCGLYSARAVPPRWRHLARAYCVTLVVAFSIYTLFVIKLFIWRVWGIWMYYFGFYILNAITALCTEDEYIYGFYTQNAVTDVTLDSPAVFGKMQRQIKRMYFWLFIFDLAFIGYLCTLAYGANFEEIIFFLILSFLKLCILSAQSTKLVMMGLFEARLLVLKRRLQRYGFRSAGRARPQPYCDIYHQILQGLDDTNNPLKLLLFIDLIYCCIRIIITVVYFAFELHLQNDIVICSLKIIVPGTLIVVIVLQSFSHVALLESAAAHCEDMAVYTVTELIKTPTAEQRYQMLSFLGALERRGARYHVLRALPLNARVVLQVLTFCIAQIFAFVNSTNTST